MCGAVLKNCTGMYQHQSLLEMLIRSETYRKKTVLIIVKFVQFAPSSVPSAYENDYSNNNRQKGRFTGRRRRHLASQIDQRASSRRSLSDHF